MPTTIAEAVRSAVKKIERSRAIDHWQEGRAQDDAETMLGFVIKQDVEDLDFTQTLTPAAIRRFEKLVARRAKGEPVPLVTGQFDFRGLTLAARKGVFIPRYSSELIVDSVTAQLRRRRGERIVVDVCTGAAPVALALANEIPRAEVWGVDISRDAVELSRRNASRLGLSNAKFRCGDLMAPLPKSLLGRVAAVTMHPPYVGRGEVETLPKEIRDWEPVSTLTDHSDDGLGLVRRIAIESQPWMARGARVYIEIGPYLARKTATILRRADFSDVEIERDDLGATRVVSGRH